VWAGLGPDDCRNPLFDTPASAFTEFPDPVLAFAYDAAVALTLTLKQAAVLPPSPPEALLSRLRAQTFHGASGHLAFLNSTSNLTVDDNIFDASGPLSIAGYYQEGTEGDRAARGLELVVFQVTSDLTAILYTLPSRSRRT